MSKELEVKFIKSPSVQRNWADKNSDIYKAIDIMVADKDKQGIRITCNNNIQLRILYRLVAKKYPLLRKKVVGEEKAILVWKVEG